MLNASAVVFVSSAYRDALTARYKNNALISSMLREKSVVIPNGINDTFFAPDNFSHRTELDAPVQIISAAMIDQNKNHLNLARAVDMLNQQGYSLELTVIGRSVDESITRELKSYSFVKVLPPVTQDELKKVYRAADIFALTSFYETFGLVYAEALSQGLPIIYTRGQGFDGQFPDGYVGYHVDAGEIKSIAEGIKSVIGNYGALQAHTRSAARKFRWDAVAMSYYDLYKRILSGGSK